MFDRGAILPLYFCIAEKFWALFKLFSIFLKLCNMFQIRRMILLLLHIFRISGVNNNKLKIFLKPLTYSPETVIITVSSEYLFSVFLAEQKWELSKRRDHYRIK